MSADIFGKRFGKDPVFLFRFGKVAQFSDQMVHLHFSFFALGDIHDRDKHSGQVFFMAWRCRPGYADIDLLAPDHLVDCFVIKPRQSIADVFKLIDEFSRGLNAHDLLPGF